MSTKNPETGKWETNPTEGVKKEDGGRAYATSDGRKGAPVPAMSDHPDEMLEQHAKDNPTGANKDVDDPEKAEETLSPPTLIFESRELSDNLGRRVTERMKVLGETPANFVQFIGHHAVEISPDLATFFSGRQHSPYRFPIEDAVDAETAFVRWEHWARHYGQLHTQQLQKKVQEAQRPRIELPTPGMTLPGMSGP